MPAHRRRNRRAHAAKGGVQNSFWDLGRPERLQGPLGAAVGRMVVAPTLATRSFAEGRLRGISPRRHCLQRVTA